MTDGRENLIWRKSRFCASNACIEVATGADGQLVRDSTDPDGPRLSFDSTSWALFIAAVRHDEQGLSG
ncbi:DUF397 domain-containing protein [Dactylosporangium cerinum]|uniref:DUF397 domain-containing protein n=1 Tax=Dactylosporangium cerinum TaxID=1434730 RepID=A0ABV9VKX9_9ACTN